MCLLLLQWFGTGSIRGVGTWAFGSLLSRLFCCVMRRVVTSWVEFIYLSIRRLLLSRNWNSRVRFGGVNP